MKRSFPDTSCSLRTPLARYYLRIGVLFRYQAGWWRVLQVRRMTGVPRRCLREVGVQEAVAVFPAHTVHNRPLSPVQP